MRPRHKAAENSAGTALSIRIGVAASMRPRHKAAENGTFESRTLMVLDASMRPRHKAAENSGNGRYAGGGISCFNEAAA